MGGRGLGSGGGLNPNDIVSTRDMITQRGNKQTEVDEILGVLRDVQNEYGIVIGEANTATLKGSGSNALAYYGGGELGVNEKYFDKKRMDSAYSDTVKSGFHPSSGNKSGLEAVIAHEMGHAFSHSKNLNEADIIKTAVKSGGFKNAQNLAKSISGYAKTSNAECIAEAFSDFYCNGKNASKGSLAIMDALRKYS